MQYLDPSFLIPLVGLVGVIVIIFAESGLFFGFFLPGDSLLLTAGLFAARGLFGDMSGAQSFWILYVGCLIAAIVGDSVGYAFGKKVGPALFTKEDSLLFNHKHIAKAQHFYEKHGGKTIILARFMPIIRTFAPIVAGIGQMSYRKFLSYNVIGGFLWVTAFLSAGYFLGNIPGVDTYFHYIIIIVILVSFLPGVIHVIQERKKPKI